MQKKKPNQSKLIKQTIIITAIALLLLLLIFAKNIIKQANKNKLNLAENTEPQTIATEANPPTTSAGIIPIKWDGENWVITTKTDWYDYKSGKPAYMMLNDGTYQSELQVDMTNKKLAEENIGMKIQPDELGTIFIWIPSFAINENGSDIKYIKDIQTPEEGWTKPEMFTYKQANETYPDFLLTGIWFEKDVDNAYTTKINQMNQEESIYEFIRNTVTVPSDQTTQNTIQQYMKWADEQCSPLQIGENTTGENIEENGISNNNQTTNTMQNVGATIGRPEITAPTNPNRIILKIVNTKNQNPIKAKASYNKDTGLIEVQVTYTQYGINKILYENTQELKLTKNGKQATATSEGINVEYGTAKITIIDNQGNTKELELAITSKVFVTLYTDGTLGFCSNTSKIAGKTVSKEYGDISGKEFILSTDIPWYSQKNSPVKTVEFVDKIAPISTSYWFIFCTNLTTINNIENLNTSNVTSMVNMFGGCNSLETLDLSSFNTSKVTDMQSMFSSCSHLTVLDLSSFDTRNVTNMSYMFYGCSSLTSLDVSNFDTRNVTNMSCMFYGCSSLTSLDLSKFDTINVTDMSSMFDNCINLTQITFSKNWNKEITLPGLRKTCEGWYSDLEFTTKVAEVGANYIPTEEITIYAKVPSDMYVTLYSDGTLTFSSTDIKVENKDIIKSYGDISGMTFDLRSQVTWRPDQDKIKVVEFLDKITPFKTKYWFDYCNNLTEVKQIENLDTRNVTNMEEMFYGCSSLTSLDVSSFDTSNVTNMDSMFGGCSSLTSIDVSSFDTSNVTNMYAMFRGCSSLKSLDLSSFDTSNVTNMYAMFSDCSDIVTLDLSNFDTSNVTTMREMFYGCSSLTSLNLISFDTSNVTNMSYMFYGCSSLSKLDLSNFDTSSVTDMTYMFYDCINLTQISFAKNWKKTISLPSLRKACDGWYSEPEFTNKVAEVGANYIPTEEITIYAKVPSDMYVTLYSDGTLAFSSTDIKVENKDIIKSYGDISSMRYVQYNSIVWYYDIDKIKTVEFLDKITPIETTYWFSDCTNITTIHNIEKLNTSRVIDMGGMFRNCSSLTELDLSSFNTSNVLGMGEMFYGCSNLANINLSNFDTSNVTYMSRMFYNCSSLTSLDLSSFDTRQVKYNDDMLIGCTILSQISFGDKWTKQVRLPTLTKPYTGWYSNKDFTNKVAEVGAYYTPVEPIIIYADLPLDLYVKLYTDGTLAFCSNSSQIPFKTLEQDYGNIAGQNYTWANFPWRNKNENITNVYIIDKIYPVYTSFWFSNCTNITTIHNIEKLNTSRVINMGAMFSGCSSLTTLDLTNFDTSRVINMGGMFRNCSSLTELDLSSFNTSNVSDMRDMFYDCSNLKTIYVNNSTSMWSNSITNSISSSSPYYNMFYNCGTSTVTRK